MSDETHNESEAQDTWDPPLPVPVPSEARRVCVAHVFCSSPGLSLYHSLRLEMAAVYENNSYMLKHGLPRFVLMQFAFIVLTSQRHFLLQHDCHGSWFEVLGSPASEARLARAAESNVKGRAKEKTIQCLVFISWVVVLATIDLSAGSHLGP